MQKQLKRLFFTILCVMGFATLACTSAAASDKVIYIANGASGDGSSASSALGTLTAAYKAAGDGDATFVICGALKITARFNAPAHTGKITFTSVYGGVDYRADGAAFNIQSYTFACGGETEFADLNISAGTGVIAGNFKGLTLGEGITTSGKIYICGGNNNEKTTAFTGQSYLTVNSGKYLDVCTFGRSTANVSHTGKMTVSIGGTTVVTGGVNLGVGNAASSKGGSADLTLSGSAAVPTLYISGNGGMNGSVNVRMCGKASVTAFGNYAASYFSGGLRALIYEPTVKLPSGFASCFDTAVEDTGGDTKMKSVLLALPNDLSGGLPETIWPHGVTAQDTADGLLLRYAESYTDFVVKMVFETAGGSALLTCLVTENGGTAAGALTERADFGKDAAPAFDSDSFAAAFSSLPLGGTIVVCGEVAMTSFTAPACSAPVTVTSVYGGTDYRNSGAKLVYAGSANFTLGSETHFENLTVEIATTGVISAGFNKLVFGDGMRVNYDDTVDANGLYIVGGHNKGDNAQAAYAEDPCIVIHSGKISRIVAFSRYSGARVHTGTASVTVDGDAHIRYVFLGAVSGGSVAASANLYLGGDAVIENLYTGGSETANAMTGDVNIYVDGGDIWEFDSIPLYAVAGSKRLIYDPRTVADGVVFLADLALFDCVETVCAYENAHRFGGAHANPFDKDVQIHSCSVCGYTEYVNADEMPARVAEDVVFLADGGFGDGRSPAYPTADYEAALKAVRAGGTVVLVGKYTLVPNHEFKNKSEPKCFQEPVHSGTVTVTSQYGGVDYRAAGAKFVFDGDIDYRMSGDVIFDHIIFDAEHTSATTIAARYHRVVFGSDCEMLKNYAEDHYKLTLLGGYQYFRYNDLVGLEIAEETLRVCNSILPYTEDSLPDSAIVTRHTNAGATYTLRADAAAAFDDMIAAMEAEGLKTPYMSDASRTYLRQYALFTNAVGSRRRKAGCGFEAAVHYVSQSCGLPGGSEHHLGYAVDIYDNTLGYGGLNHHHYDETAEWAWLVENGPKYGFVHRFSKDKVAQTGFIYEAWHFRYVGAEHAEALADSGLCLEEYVGELYGLMAKDSDVEVNSGSFYEISGGSRGADHLTFTGKRSVTLAGTATAVLVEDVAKRFVTVTAAASAGGGIAPAGVTEAAVGEDITYTISAEAGYVLCDVTVDGISVGAAERYVFTGLSENHTIYAEFARCRHENTVESVTVPKSCTEPGEMTVVCKDCGYSYTEPIPAGHSFGGWAETKPVRPGVAGEEARRCTVCGFAETRPIPALPEKEGNRNLIALVIGMNKGKYTVRFDTVGAAKIGSQTVQKGKTVTAPENPVKLGFRFAGWYADARYQTPYDFTAPVRGDMTLFAKWETAELPMPS